MTNLNPSRLAKGGQYRNTVLLSTVAVFLILAPSCRQRDQAATDHKPSTWADRFPQDDCVPRTPQAKAQLGGCPKLADPQHPTSGEARDFVEYMNKKQAIEGTVILGQYRAPGCVKWTINPTTSQPQMQFTQQTQGCSDTEEQLKKYHTP